MISVIISSHLAWETVHPFTLATQNYGKKSHFKRRIFFWQDFDDLLVNRVQKMPKHVFNPFILYLQISRAIWGAKKSIRSLKRLKVVQKEAFLRGENLCSLRLWSDRFKRRGNLFLIRRDYIHGYIEPSGMKNGQSVHSNDSKLCKKAFLRREKVLLLCFGLFVLPMPSCAILRESYIMEDCFVVLLSLLASEILEAFAQVLKTREKGQFKRKKTARGSVFALVFVSLAPRALSHGTKRRFEFFLFVWAINRPKRTKTRSKRMIPSASFKQRHFSAFPL